MTDEELDWARAAEAWRIYHLQPAIDPSPNVIAARLAREGWMPVDPLVIEAREICASVMDREVSITKGNQYREGVCDGGWFFDAVLAALKRGIEIGKEKAGD